MLKKLFPISIAFLICFCSCSPSLPIPKPKGYFKIDLPEQHIYQQFDSTTFPFSFEYPVYSKITQDSQLVKEDHAPFWINIYFPSLNATIYLSYKEITIANPLRKLINDSYNMSFAHDIRADYIKTPQFTTPNGLVGVFYNIGGNAASAYQFFITDQKKNFVRGALYFNVTPNADSLKPASDFLREDMHHLVNTFQFKISE